MFNIAYYMPQPLQLVGVCAVYAAVVQFVFFYFHITVYFSLSE